MFFRNGRDCNKGGARVKKIVGIFVVLGLAVAAWASATYYIGGEVEKQYFAFLDQYSRQQPYVVLKNKSYRRGFLQSTAETVVLLIRSGRIPPLASFWCIPCGTGRSLSGKPRTAACF